MDLNIHNSRPRLFIPTRAQFLQSCLPQEFPFKMTTMKYIWMNPSSSKVYQKLIQCCKLFFIKNPILVFDELSYVESNYEYGWLYKDAKTNEWESIGDEIQNNIWVTKELCIQSHSPESIASDVIPKIVRYNVEDLTLTEQELTYAELKFFASGVKKCDLGYNYITYDDDETVPLENILQLFSNCEDLEISSKESICESYVALADACQTIKKFKLYDVPDDFDAVGFYQYIKKIKNRCLVTIYLSDQIQGVDGVHDEILETDSFDFVPPIFWGSYEHGKLEKIEEIQEEVANKLC